MTHYIKNLITSVAVMVALATIGVSVANASEIAGTLSSNGSYSATVVTTSTGGGSNTVTSTVGGGGGGGGGGNGPVAGSLTSATSGSATGDSVGAGGNSPVAESITSGNSTTVQGGTQGATAGPLAQTNGGGPIAQNAGGLTDLTGSQNPATNQNANQLAAVVTSGASLSGWLLWILLAVLLATVGYYLYRRNRGTKKLYRQKIG